jgi:hypothetical protein
MAMTVSIWLVGVLAVSAALKARSFGATSEALATYAVPAGRARRLAAACLIAVELAAAIALASGAAWASGAVASLFAAFAAGGAVALAAGRGGRPCACFGGSSRLSWASPALALAPAAAAVVLAAGVLPRAGSAYESWLTLGLSVAIAGAGALAVAVLALAREIAVLRLGISDRGALEMAQEGPSLGSVQAWAARRPPGRRAVLRLAVFTSEACPLCRRASPALAHVTADPLLAVEVFDEAEHEDVWREAGVPGSPYAIALTLDGAVLAKGAFNGLLQLESIIGTARFRERERPLAA